MVDEELALVVLQVIAPLLLDILESWLEHCAANAVVKGDVAELNTAKREDKRAGNSGSVLTCVAVVLNNPLCVRKMPEYIAQPALVGFEPFDVGFSPTGEKSRGVLAHFGKVLRVLSAVHRHMDVLNPVGVESAGKRFDVVFAAEIEGLHDTVSFEKIYIPLSYIYGSLAAHKNSVVGYFSVFCRIAAEVTAIAHTLER